MPNIKRIIIPLLLIPLAFVAAAVFLAVPAHATEILRVPPPCELCVHPTTTCTTAPKATTTSTVATTEATRPHRTTTTMAPTTTTEAAGETTTTVAVSGAEVTATPQAPPAKAVLAAPTFTG